MKKKAEENFKASNKSQQQFQKSCWKLENFEATITFGITLPRKFPNLKILLLQGPLGAGKTTLVKGIARGLGIQEPVTSPTFSLAQHYPAGKPPLVHLDLYRLENHHAANELFLEEEEEMKAMGGLMVVEWPERLSLNLPEAWQGTLDYLEKEEGRIIQLSAPDS